MDLELILGTLGVRQEHELSEIGDGRVSIVHKYSHMGQFREAGMVFEMGGNKRTRSNPGYGEHVTLQNVSGKLKGTE